MIEFDSDELYHLAVKASQANDHAGAIKYLKQAIEQGDGVRARYLLAAEHAEIGMIDRAIEEMSDVVRAEPTLWTAHYQLGLLYFALNRHEEAVGAWRRLLELPEEDPLALIAVGLIAMLEGDQQLAREHLERGIELNTSNPAINQDIQKIIARFMSDNTNQQTESLRDSARVGEEDVAKEASVDSSKFFLSTYDKATKPS